MFDENGKAPVISRSEAERELQYLISLRRELHMHPETAMREFNTALVIERELDKLGVPHRRVGETGVLGIIKCGNGIKAVALRADIDALPVSEKNDCEYKSLDPDCMHACGHDAHTAMLLGAAKLLTQNKDKLNGEIRLIFQPGEETGEGAADFIDEGALENVSAAFGMHTAPDLPVRTVGIKAGPNNAAVEGFRIEVFGKGVHVSTPDLGVDALYIASHIVVAIQALASRRTSPTEPIIFGIGKFKSGTSYNAVADYAVLDGTTRTSTEEARARARKQVDGTAQSIAKIYGGTARVTWTHIASALTNHEELSKELAKMVAEKREDLKVITDRQFYLSGDNFSEFQLKVPGVYAYLGTADPARECTQYPIHSPNFEIDESSMAIGAWLYAETAAHLLG